jgi:hypothetical protein
MGPHRIWSAERLCAKLAKRFRECSDITPLPQFFMPRRTCRALGLEPARAERQARLAPHTKIAKLTGSAPLLTLLALADEVIV